jgi:hypothetical protein
MGVSLFWIVRKTSATARTAALVTVHPEEFAFINTTPLCFCVWYRSSCGMGGVDYIVPPPQKRGSFECENRIRFERIGKGCFV